MATIDLTGHPASGVSGAPGAIRLSKVLDFSETNRADADVLQLFDIEEGWKVVDAFIDVRTVEDSTATCTLGDGTDPDGYLTPGGSVNLETLGETALTLDLTTGTPNTVTAYTAGKLYTAADTVDLVLSGAVNTAVIAVSIIVHTSV